MRKAKTSVNAPINLESWKSIGCSLRPLLSVFAQLRLHSLYNIWLDDFNCYPIVKYCTLVFAVSIFLLFLKKVIAKKSTVNHKNGQNVQWWGYLTNINKKNSNCWWGSWREYPIFFFFSPKFVFDHKKNLSKIFLLPFLFWPLCFDNKNWVWEPKARVPNPPQVLEWRPRSGLIF